MEGDVLGTANKLLIAFLHAGSLHKVFPGRIGIHKPLLAFWHPKHHRNLLGDPGEYPC
jgi:hypothetical protein